MRDARISAGASERQRRRIVSHVIPLLGDGSLAREADDYLREIASQVVGQLVDGLLDPEEEQRVRTRLARVLGRVGDPRAMAGLWCGVEAADFGLRLECARAAARIVSRSPELAPPGSEVYARVASELAVDDEVWTRQGRRAPTNPADRSVLLDRTALRSVSRSLEQIFTLLSLAHEREVMASVLAGLASDEPELRGTALEYLESVLPASLRGKLWPRLHADRERQASGRPGQEVAAELLRSSAAVVIRSDALGGDS
jgi:HEAT repeat protein